MLNADQTSHLDRIDRALQHANLAIRKANRRRTVVALNEANEALALFRRSVNAPMKQKTRGVRVEQRPKPPAPTPSLPPPLPPRAAQPGMIPITPLEVDASEEKPPTQTVRVEPAVVAGKASQIGGKRKR